MHETEFLNFKALTHYNWNCNNFAERWVWKQLALDKIVEMIVAIVKHCCSFEMDDDCFICSLRGGVQGPSFTCM